MTMKVIAASVLAASILVSGVSFAADNQASGQMKVNCNVKSAPQMVDGQVLKVDLATNTITVKESNGTTHEFQASKETLQDLKAGDRIEARLRPAQNC
jgi:hypothetical protein